MYLRKVVIKDVRTFASFEWTCTGQEPSGWHVLIGDNGSGKTTILRCMALGLMRDHWDEVKALRNRWRGWPRNGARCGTVKTWVDADEHYDFNRPRPAVPSPTADGVEFSTVTFPTDATLGPATGSFPETTDADLLDTTVGAWFSASYGPFRRFSGDDEQDRRLYQTHPGLARHLTLFDDSFALSACIPWLRNLDHKALAAHRQGGGDDHPDIRFLRCVKEFINQPDFLPHGTRLTDITPDSVLFRDGNGAVVELEELSDGYRSVISMALELLRQLSRTYPLDQLFAPDEPTHIAVPGVVLIDEVDAHLHPTWQREIGFWFQRYFPKIQFIISTHSPVICRAAIGGSIYRLPSPGSDEPGGRLSGPTLDRLLYGNVLEAYGTEAFGADMARSRAGQQKLERLAELNYKEQEQGLTPAEQDEQDALRASMPTAAYALTARP